jgi:MFS family permease
MFCVERDYPGAHTDGVTKTSPPSKSRRDGRFWFWTVAAAFTVVMAFTTAPTPLWSLFAQHDHFSSLTITIAFAAYAVAVALSLFLAGHLSDWFGRRRVVALGLALNVLSAVVFVVWPALAGLLMARVLSGLGVGVVTATATAWLAELDAAGRPAHTRSRAQIAAATANLGGLGLGGLIAGVIAQWVGDALTVPVLLLGGLIVLSLLAISFAPETREPSSPHPPYRPQRVSVPPASRARFFAAATGAAVTFAIFGLITSLAPRFLAGTLHQPSRALAGAVSFAMFAVAAMAQTLTGARTPHQLLAAAIPALLTGIGLLTLAVWVPSPSFGLFLAGDLIAGAGAGLMFKGAIGTVSDISLPERRAEALAGLYLAAYLGLAGPVIGLGALTQVASTRVSLLVFSGLLALGIFAATPALLGGRGHRTSTKPQPIAH